MPAIQPRLGKTLINSLNLVEDFAGGCRNDFNPLPLVSLKSKTKGTDLQPLRCEPPNQQQIFSEYPGLLMASKHVFPSVAKHIIKCSSCLIKKMTGPERVHAQNISAKVNVAGAERRGRFLRASNVLHSLHSTFVPVSSKNRHFHPLLEMTGLAVHTLSLVCSQFQCKYSH